jgi:predicted PurR-regulated permease PerM
VALVSPLYRRLSRVLPPALAGGAVVLTYTLLLVAIGMLLLPPTPLDLVYLDLGR